MAGVVKRPVSSFALRRSVDPLARFADSPAMKTLELPLGQMTAGGKLRAIETIWEHLVR